MARQVPRRPVWALLLALNMLVTLGFAGGGPVAGHVSAHVQLVSIGAEELGSGPHATPAHPSVIQLSHDHPGGSPSLAVNRYGAVLADWMDWSGPSDSLPPSTAAYATSDDSGLSFSSEQSLPAFGQGIPSSGLLYESDVSTTSGSLNGTFSIGYQSQPTPCGYSASQMTVTSVWDNGSVPGSPVLTVPCRDAATYVDREWIGSSPNGTRAQIADVTTGPDALDLLLSRSFGGGVFQAPEILARNSFVPIGILPYNDSLWAAAYTATNRSCQIEISDDGGTGWSNVSGLLPADCASAVDPPWSSVGAGLEWQAAWGPASTLDVAYVNASGLELTQSKNLGSSWSPPVLLSGTVAAGTAFQTPTIQSDPTTGETVVTWLDSRSDPSNLTWQVYCRESADNGASWGPVLNVSAGVVGHGRSFWTGDSIGSLLTPWGTVATAWGGDDSNGTLQPYFAQQPIENPNTANLTVSVVNASGVPLSNLLVEVNGHPARTDALGRVEYFDLGPGTDQVAAISPTLGIATGNVTAFPGSATSVTLTLGPARLAGSIDANPVSGAAPLQVSFAALLAGGVLPINTTWRFGDGATSYLPDTTHVYLEAGEYLARLWANDSDGHSIAFWVPITVSPPEAPLHVRVVAGPNPAISGNPVLITALAGGGSGNYTGYEWAGLPSSCSAAEEPVVNCSTAVAGSYDLTVLVIDSAGNNASASLRLTIDQGGVTGESGSPDHGTVIWVVVASSGAASVSALSLVWLRSRRLRPPPPRSKLVAGRRPPG